MEIEEQIKKDQSERAYAMVCKVIETAEPRLLANYREDVSLWMPKIVVEYFKNYFEFKNNVKPGKSITFRGYELNEWPLPIVALIHKDYPLFKEDWMKSTVEF